MSEQQVLEAASKLVAAFAANDTEAYFAAFSEDASFVFHTCEQPLPTRAAYRELWEETGVTRDKVEFVGKTHGWVTYDLPPELLGKVWGGKYRGQKQKWFLFRFKGQDSDVKIASEHPEFSTWRWILADEMVQSIVPFKRAVYEEVVRSFRAYLA